MTEKGERDVARDEDNLQIGASQVRWTGDALEIDIEERDTRLFNPIHRPVRGKIRVIPELRNETAFTLDAWGRHTWHCIAPRASIEVDIPEPGIRWQGSAYLDHNRGTESLEAGFRDWHWSRAHLGKDVAVLYEGRRRDGSEFASALRFSPDGTPQEMPLPMVAPLPRTLWQVERRTRGDRGHAGIIRTWEDSPFYARSTIATRLFGEPVTAIQESLMLDRFKLPIVQFMLPYRMPRSA